jgi:hypothetical protein
MTDVHRTIRPKTFHKQKETTMAHIAFTNALKDEYNRCSRRARCGRSAQATWMLRAFQRATGYFLEGDPREAA